MMRSYLTLARLKLCRGNPGVPVGWEPTTVALRPGSIKEKEKALTSRYYIDESLTDIRYIYHNMKVD